MGVGKMIANTLFSVFRVKKGASVEEALATKKYPCRLSLAVLLSCSARERQKSDQSGASSFEGDTPFAPVPMHFSSARVLSGTKLDMSRVEKV
jgi:hypothetical protein